ncbi:MAG TPA: VOC family protein [Allosphingosinicella sp.]|uniref:VOC family protein n=1 Tax=Allosphingosinicella sp. TaxID=2823234 RepID=UPI002ED87163
MARMIFVNLPVADLQKSVDFYKAIGAEQNLQFTDDTASMVSFSNEINVMLLTHDKFRQFTSRRIADRDTAEVLLALSCDSREEVDEITEKALAAGSREPSPVDDHGWMYGRSFEDPDGHGWGPCWLDVEAATRAMAERAA